MSEDDRRRDDLPLTIRHYNPVRVTVGEAIGTILLGLLAILLLLALLRSQARNRELLRRLAGEG